MLKAMQDNQHATPAWVYRIGQWIFPSITELQVVLAYSVGAGLLLTHPESLRLIWKLATGANHIDATIILIDILYLAVIVTPLVVIIRKKTLGNDMKTFIESLYFLFLALLALAALGSAQLTSDTAVSFVWVNAWVVRLALGLAVLRAFLTILAAKSGDADLQRFVSQNFKDTQFRPLAFALTFTIGVGSVLLLQHSYSDVAVVALLSLAYSGAAISLLSRLSAATTG